MDFIRQNYNLPDWFEIHDIDFLRFYCRKNDDPEIILDDNRFNAFSTYLAYLYSIYCNRGLDDNRGNLSQSEIEDILTIRICDYKWDGIFTHSEPKYDIHSKDFILQKK